MEVEGREWRGKCCSRLGVIFLFQTWVCFVGVGIFLGHKRACLFSVSLL